MADGPPTSAGPSLEDLVFKIANARAADVFFYAGDIERPAAAGLVRCVLKNVQRKNALLFLTTFGGSGDAAYQMARCLQNKYQEGKVLVLVASYCKSAGTLLTLGANSLIMAESAELGPLDVQITKPDTLGERTSGLTPSQSLTTLRTEAFQCFEKFFLDILQSSGYAITTRTAAMIAASVTAGLYRPVYAQIDPMRLGEFQRAVQIAMEYGRRLDSWSKNLKDRALAKLINGYPSHEFVIDRREAETLFNRVERPTAEEQSLSDMLHGDAMKAAGGKNADIRYLGSGGERPENGSGPAADSSGARPRSPRARAKPPGDGVGNRPRTEREEQA